MQQKTTGDWLYFKTPYNNYPPDYQELNFCRKGEFSPESDIAFDKHIDRLKKLNDHPMFKKMNGKRIKEICKTEPLRYWRP